MSAAKKPTKATSATPATEAPAVYRGPDRRADTDRRSGEDRRTLGASPSPEVLEQRCGEDRRGGVDRRNELRGALWDTCLRAEDANAVLQHELEPLLAVCEFATLAHQALTDIDTAAGYDPALRQALLRLPGWNDCLAEPGTVGHIGRCLTLARALRHRISKEVQALTDEADAVGSSLHRDLQQEQAAKLQAEQQDMVRAFIAELQAQQRPKRKAGRTKGGTHA